MSDERDLDASAEFLTARLSLARMHVSGPESLKGVCRELLALSAQMLEVDRVGLWFFEAGGAVLRCAQLFERGAHRFSEPEDVLRPVDFPSYTRALREQRAVVADDVHAHPLTAELQGYLHEHGITSMLDAPLYRSGEVVGVLCHEHTGPARRWTARERDFAISVTESLAVLLEQGDRAAAERTAREAEKRQQEHRRMAAMGRMARAVAHDFNNTLAVIAMTAERVQTLRAEDSMVTHSMGLIVEATRRSSGLIQQLLAFGRDEPSRPEPVRLGAWAKRARMLLAGMLPGSVELLLGDAPEELAAMVDPTDLDRVVLNLVSNARDAMPGGGALGVRFERGSFPSGEPAACVEVSDTGTGMSAETLARSFEPFFTTKGEGRGNGLGLAIVRQLVEHAGGDVSARSELGKGTTFCVRLPLAAG